MTSEEYTLEAYESDVVNLQKNTQEELKKIKSKHKAPNFSTEYEAECEGCKTNYSKNLDVLQKKFHKSYNDTINGLDKYKNIKEKNMSGEDVSDLKAEIAGLKATIKNKKESEYTDFLKGITSKVDGLTQKVDGVCTEVGGCRKDINTLGDKLGERFDKQTVSIKEKFEKDNKDTCVGLDCVKNSLKEVKADTVKLDKLNKLDKLDQFELHDCPFCDKKVIPVVPKPADFCPGCGKSVKELWETEYDK